MWLDFMARRLSVSIFTSSSIWLIKTLSYGASFGHTLSSFMNPWTDFSPNLFMGHSRDTLSWNPVDMHCLELWKSHMKALFLKNSLDESTKVFNICKFWKTRLEIEETIWSLFFWISHSTFFSVHLHVHEVFLSLHSLQILHILSKPVSLSLLISEC
jgi:hypothetical protein